MNVATEKVKKGPPDWVAIVRRYQAPDLRKAIWQILNTGIPFTLIWILMVYSLKVSYFLSLGLAFLNALFLMRLFIIQHDCGHNAFFKSTKWNNIVGTILGVITLTPYYHWRKSHAKHHAGSGDLDFRGFGDVETITVKEYQQLNLWNKFRYRFYRHPFVLFIVGPTILFAFLHRLPMNLEPHENKERLSVHQTNAALLGVFLILGFWIGFVETIILWLPITVFSSMIGVYLFYVQHQFEDTYWRWHDEWEYEHAALQGSSYFKLPKILQWFSGNIGFHHVHHLSPKIPNYNLERAHNENEIFQDVETITIATSIRTIFLNLWDESSQRLISFGEYRRRFKSAASKA